MPEITDDEYWKMVGLSPGKVRPLVATPASGPVAKPPPLIFGDRIIEASSFSASGPWTKVPPEVDASAPARGDRPSEATVPHRQDR